MLLLAIYQKVNNFFKDHPGVSQREAAQAIGMSKSAVGRHRQSELRRTRYPESVFWNTEAGQQWLSRLIVSVLYFFAIQRGIGLDSLSYFFQMLRIESHVGVSASSLRALFEQLEEALLQYEKDCQQQISSLDTLIEVVAGFDETFFERMILVAMDLSSGFIFMEEYSKNRTFDTWFQKASEGLGRWKIQVRQLVSDRAKALLKLAHDGCHCPHLPDLFHAAHEAVKALGLPLFQKTKQAGKQLQESQKKLRETAVKAAALPQYLTEDILTVPLASCKKHQKELADLEEGNQLYNQTLHNLSKAVHPFSAEDAMPQNSKQTLTKLQEAFKQLKKIRERFDIKDASKHLEKLGDQLEDIANSIDFWWCWVEQSLMLEHLTKEGYQWLTAILLPAYYWQYQFTRTDQPLLKRFYQNLAQRAQGILATHHYSKHLTAEELNHWHHWADDFIKKFQRTSSAVEGRNGYLSQIYHTTRGVTSKRLRLLTIIHNFGLKRLDGTSAAQRLYQREFPDLFEYLIDRAPPLALSRQSKKRGGLNSLKLLVAPL